ncbi:DUF1286 domain-containing protein [Saccharolobus solfataricus]|uniref:DUF1286 domain-containing protein n=3 Tax=Saccharolobus solfataricus TaxID=2287 RepID=Q97X56_SACS2|nr:DUF1286 domain-containing protein [Saccharolobus solfataricus]AAK42089.1 Hypothetical protein SSO1899 [Saccharolobus solfataricus P2]AKA74789.1 DUF1286 domain-containing protein [Saccharolobus solfataricus]AKA77485.1 DUF1286 domain-containing protein [Saccharolobus solfataricus]AKA80175.1 DUF1286 domain-containing protein [Saccharolobus solfataricus]AZF69257.1 DUF1286 domain-containing protein [Saccharolobus solfataricus]
MRLRTHYVFSTGLLTLLDSGIFHEYFYYTLILCGIVSVIGNSLIDRIGHKEIITRYGYISMRTPLTHTIPRSVVWGIISIIPIFILLLIYYYGLNYHEYYLFSINNRVILLTLLNGIVVGPSHMLLDVFTERGIYVKKYGKWRRFALAHFKYDNPAINGLAIIVGIIMIYLAYL